LTVDPLPDDAFGVGASEAEEDEAMIL